MNAKKLAAEKAVSYIQDGMTVGLGTGSTALFAIEAIGKLVREGLSVHAVASSIKSEQLAMTAGINMIGFDSVKKIDFYIDGADEVDKEYNLIKGGGGALVREKILAFNSEQFIVIIDNSKLVDQLGKFPVAVEVVPFGMELTRENLAKLDCTLTLRLDHDKPFLSDNKNYIIDCAFGNIIDPEKLEIKINNIPGVVGNGLFNKNIVNRVVVGYESGEVKVLEK
jgi:ribose 5-phosphate isomerase A